MRVRALHELSVRVPGKNAHGRFVKSANVHSGVTIAEFALDFIQKADTHPSCLLLPVNEKQLPINEKSHHFNLTSNLSANLKVHEMGPGCLWQCGCLAKLAAGAVPAVPSGGSNSSPSSTPPSSSSDLVFNCTAFDYETCPCLQHKARCHDAIVRAWKASGGGLDVHSDTADYTAPGPSGRRERRKLEAKALFELRVETKQVRRLMPTTATRVLEEIEAEKERLRRVRRRVRELRAVAEREEREQDMWSK